MRLLQYGLKKCYGLTDTYGHLKIGAFIQWGVLQCILYNCTEFLQPYSGGFSCVQMH